MASGLSLARRAARITGRTLGVGAVGGVTVGAYLYANEPGVERSVRFWRYVGPILVHYGWEKAMAKDDEDRAVRFQRLHDMYAPQARRAIEDLRGMFIKVGQVMSVRPEVMPEAYRNEFRKVQDSAPAARWDPIRDSLESGLGTKVDDLFEHIDRNPLGAASIGQAHLVKWRGRSAVVKVQYPDSRAMFYADFRCLETLLWLIDQQDALRISSQLRQQFEQELDYKTEAANLKALHGALSAAPEFRDRVALPEPIPELTGGNIVGMTYLDGTKLEIALRQRLEAMGIDLKDRSFAEVLASHQRDRLSEHLRDEQGHQVGPAPVEVSPQDGGSTDEGRNRFLVSVLRAAAQIFGVNLFLWLARSAVDLKLWIGGDSSSQADGSSGSQSRSVGTSELRSHLKLLLDVHGYQLFFCPLFNADPHPGNVLLLEDGRLGLIDFGQCRRLVPEEREAIARLLFALRLDPNAPGADAAVAEAFLATGVRTKSSNERYLALLPRLMFCSLRPEWLNREFIGEVMRLDTIETFPTYMIMVYRTSMLLRGLCLVMQENFSVAEVWCSWAERWMAENKIAR